MTAAAEKWMHVGNVKCHQAQKNGSKYHVNGETFFLILRSQYVHAKYST
jgi:hypothetical protein